MELKEIKQTGTGKQYVHKNQKVYSTTAIAIAKKIKDRKKSLANAGKAMYED